MAPSSPLTSMLAASPGGSSNVRLPSARPRSRTVVSHASLSSKNWVTAPRIGRGSVGYSAARIPAQTHPLALQHVGIDVDVGVELCPGVEDLAVDPRQRRGKPRRVAPYQGLAELSLLAKW